MTSHIDPHGRHLLLTLLSKTDASTAEIPTRHVPTFDDLASMTGISKSTITEWMKTLTDAKWISREQVDGESRKALRLAVGDPKAARTMRVRKSKDTDASYRQAVQTETGHVPPRGTAHTAARYDGIPPGGMSEDPHCLIKNSPTESSNRTDLDQSPQSDDGARNDGFPGLSFGPRVSVENAPRNKTRKAAPKATTESETPGQRLNRVAKLYTDRIKLSNFFKSRAVVEAAFDAEYSEDQIVAGIEQLVSQRAPLSKDSLRIAIEGLPKSWTDRNETAGSKGYNGSGYRGRQSTRHIVRDSRSPEHNYKEKL